MTAMEGDNDGSLAWRRSVAPMLRAAPICQESDSFIA